MSVEDVKKPLATLELASSAIGLLKTASVIFVMMLLEWARLKQRRAEVETKAAKNDLEVAALKSEAKDDVRTDKEVLDDFLAARGLPASKPQPGGDAKG